MEGQNNFLLLFLFCLEFISGYVRTSWDPRVDENENGIFRIFI